MKRFFIAISFCLGLFISIQSQKVGLVLSGGGAKGIAHIGIIKALEENGIPIDFVTGTSMGAIVGGMYAMGYSPDEMIQTLKSKDFKRWSTGEVETSFNYYFRNADPKPNFVEIPFNINNIDSISLKSAILPTNLVSPRQMNYAFLPFTSQANAVCGGDFDKLFVPFRCVASDVYNKESVIFRYGNLGDAIRASMTYPFMFKPIMIDGRLLFDGGIFNNFPVDVMRKDFNPEFMIGSVVANNPRKPDQRDIIMQVQNMIMTRTDYTMTKEDGLLLKFRAHNVRLFDFNKVDELVQMGYDSTIKHIDEIKARVKRRLTKDEIMEKRKVFRSKMPEFKFQRVIVQGVDSLQKRYIEQVFHYKNEVFSLNDFKESYFKLISDDKILEVLPHAIFNSATGTFDLILSVKTQDHLKVLLGGNVSSSTSNQAYFGLSYQNLTEYAQTASMDAQFGRMYNGLSIGTRVEIPSQKSWYMKLGIVWHKFNYFHIDQLFYNDNEAGTPDFTQSEIYAKLSAGFPITMKARFEMGLGFGGLTDRYVQNRTLATQQDKSDFTLTNAFAKIESNTSNDKMYPTTGYRYYSSLQLFDGFENFESGSNSALNVSDIRDLWFQWRGKYDRYFTLSPQLTLGVYAEGMFSTRKLANNYTASLIQSQAFQPTPYTRTVFNEAFSANQFAAIGIKPIYNLTKEFHLRAEAYWFLPYQSILMASDNTAYYSAPFSKSQFMAETSLVFNFKIASASAYVNYFSSAQSQWNFGINIGFLLFNPKFTD